MNPWNLLATLVGWSLVAIVGIVLALTVSLAFVAVFLYIGIFS